MIFISLAWLSLYGLRVVGQGRRGEGVDFCSISLRYMRYHPHKQMALEETVSKERCWHCVWQKSQCRNISSKITLQMLSSTHHQFPPSRKASLINACSIRKRDDNTWISQAENLSNTNTAVEAHVDPEAFVSVCRVMVHSSCGLAWSWRWLKIARGLSQLRAGPEEGPL